MKSAWKYYCTTPLPYTINEHSKTLSLHLHLNVEKHKSYNCFCTFVFRSTLFCSFCSRRAADLVSSFFAAMCKAGSRTLPFVSCSRSTATTRSWPCCRATARGVNPSCKKNEWRLFLSISSLYLNSVIHLLKTKEKLKHSLMCGVLSTGTSSMIFDLLTLKSKP